MAPQGIRSKIVLHYIMPEDTEGNFKATCKHCNKEIACSKKALSNLHMHIKRLHPTLSIEPSTTRVKKSSSTNTSPVNTSSLLASAIAQSSLPRGLLESASFRMFCENFIQQSNQEMADRAPSLAMEAVLKPSCDLPEDMPKIRGYDFNQGVDHRALLQSYLTTGFQASSVGMAIQEINNMIEKRLEPVEAAEQNDWKEPSCSSGCTIFLGYTSNLISSGVRESIRYLAEHRMVDVIVTTAGGIEEDLIKCLAPTFLGDFALPGKDLRQRGINRIGNLLVPNGNYCKFEDWLMPILDQMVLEQNTEGTHWTPSKMIHRLGKEINNPESVYYWAYKNNIPVFSPALTDGSLGDMIYFHSYKNPGLILDIVEDIRKLNSQAVLAKRTGMIILGGGLVKHHIANANLMRNGADYSVYVNTGQEFDGSDSGARPDEAVSWGKIRTDAKPVKVFADASIVFPLLVAETFALHADKLIAGKKKD
ncbi:deoxyhypusine synthase isoform X1 [Centroberyx affinis]|uniref:deoxyhypusine synthase isoform X1 n=2 Tax=Centroberyx affinis TaxID=166261 RepID=UPI003A5C6E89